MKIIHCADLHLDSSLSSYPKDIAAKRREELLLGFGRMVEYARSNDIENILIAGDLFDKKRPSASAVKFVTDVMTSHPGINFYYLKGNHDCDELYEDNQMMPANLKMFDKDWMTYTIADLHDRQGCSVTVSAVENSDSSCATTIPALDMNAFNIVMMHGDVGEGACINLRNLRGCGIDYLALGHIHSYRYDSLDKNGYYCYPGCLSSRGFDECGEHGFVVLDIDRENKSQKVTLKSVETRDILKIDVDISECMNSVDVLEKVKSVVEANIHSSDAIFLIELTGATDISCDKNVHMLEQYFNSNYMHVRVHDNSEYRVDFKDYALDESLKGEFVRTVFADQTLSDDDKAAIIRLGIRALKGEEIDL